MSAGKGRRTEALALCGIYLWASGQLAQRLAGAGLPCAGAALGPGGRAPWALVCALPGSAVLALALGVPILLIAKEWFVSERVSRWIHLAVIGVLVALGGLALYASLAPPTGS